MPALPISPGEPLSVGFTLTDNDDPFAPAPADAARAVTAVIADTPHGPAIDPACVYTASPRDPATPGYVPGQYVVQTGAETTAPLASRRGRKVYLYPSVDGGVCDPRDVVELLVTA